MNHWNVSFRHACTDIAAFLKWSACACVVGTVMAVSYTHLDVYKRQVLVLP